MSARRTDPIPPPRDDPTPDGMVDATEHGRLLSEAWALIADVHGDELWHVKAIRWRNEWTAYTRKVVRAALDKCALCGSDESPTLLCLSCAGGGPMRTVTVLLQILEAQPNRIADLTVAPAVGVVVSHPTRGRGIVAESDEVGAFSVVWLTGERATYSLRRTGGADEKAESNAET